MDLAVLAGRMGGLTSRKKDVVDAIAKGMKKSAIAKLFNMPEQALNSLISGIYKELGLDRSLGSIYRLQLLTAAWKLFLDESKDEEAGQVPATPPEFPGGGHAASAAYSFQDPKTILGIQVLLADSPSFEQECADLIAREFYPEGITEFQSMIHLECHATRVIFIKRGPSKT